MRAGLNKEVLRNNTAYRIGRSIMDGFLLAQLVVAVVGCIGVCVYESRLEAGNFYTAAGVICGAVVLSAAAILERELVHALFDIADRALIGAAMSTIQENPFKQPG